MFCTPKYDENIMNIITANDTKLTPLIDLIEAGLKETSELMINIDGKNRFVIMEVDHYQQLQEVQCLTAWQESKHEVAQGLFHTDINLHLEKIRQAIKA
jgi:hypothetical protein